MYGCSSHMAAPQAVYNQWADSSIAQQITGDYPQK